ncbi:hypothetical protein AB0M39_14120 [Streptomyces sp. NPDC051907]|uniref:hypothetical protein n=1 Tax=Streptomyces sp. NPDC051907 TaxID=3155284 RepID=UPI00343826A0
MQTILRHAHLDTTGRYLTAHVEDLHDKLQEHYTKPRPQRAFAAGYDPEESRRCSVAEPGALTQPTSKKGVSRFVSVNAAPAPAPAVPPRPQGDLTRASVEEIAQAVRTTWPTKSADNRWNRSRGARDLLQHLSQFPGETWQERWEAGLTACSATAAAFRAAWASRAASSADARASLA